MQGLMWNQPTQKGEIQIFVLDNNYLMSQRPADPVDI